MDTNEKRLRLPVFVPVDGPDRRSAESRPLVGDALVSTNGVVPATQPPGQAFIDHVNLRQVVRPDLLWETRGSRLPLRGVIGLWIDTSSLRNLDRPRQRTPTGRGPRAVSAAVSLIRKKRGSMPRASTSAFAFDNSISFQPENFVSVLHEPNLRKIKG